MAGGREKEDRFNSRSSAVSRDRVAVAARDFLWAVAEKVKDRLGPRPERLQRSKWMVHTGPSSSMSSKVFERRVFDSLAVDMMYQDMMRNDFPEQQRLQALLTELGIPTQRTGHEFFMRLVRHWLKLPDPLAFEETAISRVVGEFVDAVIDGRVITRSCYVIDRLDYAVPPLVLEKGICIRQTEEELWELGDTDGRLRSLLLRPFDMPSEDWKILDIELQHYIRPKASPPRVVKVALEAALVALRLASSGSLVIVDLGSKYDYGIADTRYIQFLPRELGRRGDRYVLDAPAAQRLKDAWPRLRAIMEAENHYLRLPAQRLVDGGSRERMEDAIIDYAIGLEALLTEGIQDELRYRFALRGATILAWVGGNKKQLFEELSDFYNVRSKIVHGGHVDKTEVEKSVHQGEKALRDIWWWYFEKGTSSLKDATSLVDTRILE